MNFITILKEMNEKEKWIIIRLLEYAYYNNFVEDEDEPFRTNEVPEWIQSGSYNYLKNKGIKTIYRGTDSKRKGEDAFSWTYNKEIAKKLGDSLLEKELPKNIVSIEFLIDWYVKNNINFDEINANFQDYLESGGDKENEVIILYK